MTSVIDQHVKFVSLRICGITTVPKFNDPSFIRQFNDGFKNAYHNIETETELFEMEDVYFQARGSLFHFDFDIDTPENNLFMTVIKRLKRLRILGRKME